MVGTSKELAMSESDEAERLRRENARLKKDVELYKGAKQYRQFEDSLFAIECDDGLPAHIDTSEQKLHFGRPIKTHGERFLVLFTLEDFASDCLREQLVIYHANVGSARPVPFPSLRPACDGMRRYILDFKGTVKDFGSFKVFVRSEFLSEDEEES